MSDQRTPSPDPDEELTVALHADSSATEGDGVASAPRRAAGTSPGAAEPVGAATASAGTEPMAGPASTVAEPTSTVAEPVEATPTPTVAEPASTVAGPTTPAAESVEAPRLPSTGSGSVQKVAGPVEATPASTVAEPVEATPAPTKKPASLGRSSAIMAMGSLASRILGMARALMLAAIVATSGVADAFQVANTLPNILFNLLNAGVLSAVLIPQITAAMKRDDGGQDYVDRLLTAAFGAILALTVAATLATPWLVGWLSDMNDQLTHLGVLFGFICMPQILFYGLYAVFGSVLNARDQFAAFMWSPALANLVQIIGMAVFFVLWGQQTNPSHWSSAMIWTLAGTFTLGIVVQALVLVVPLLRGGFRFHLRFGLRGQGMGQAGKMLGWTLTALVIQQAGGLFVQWVLTSVVKKDPSAGGIAAYANAMTIFFLAHGLITVSVLTALFPQMTRTWQDGDVRGLRRLVTKALTTPAVAVIPASALVYVCARPLVDVMLHLPEHGASQVAQALQIMSIGTLGFGISTLQQRYSFARQEGRQNLGYQIFLTAIQVAFAVVALVAVPPARALPMVALGLVVGNWAVSVLFLVGARRQMGGLGFDRVLRLWTRLVIASLCGGGTAWLVVYGMRPHGHAWLLAALTCLLAGLAFGLVFLAVSRILHIRQVDDMVAPVLRRLHLAR